MDEEVKRPTVRISVEEHQKFKTNLIKDPRFKSIQDFLSQCIYAFNEGRLELNNKKEGNN